MRGMLDKQRRTGDALVSLIAITVVLIGCNTRTTISGVVVPIDLDIARNQAVNLVLFDETYADYVEVPARLDADGTFVARVPNERQVLMTIWVQDSDLILSTDWIEAKPIVIAPGQKLTLTDLFLSYPFELTVEYEDSVVDSVEDLRVSWAPVEAAQLYAVSLMSMGDTRELVSMFVTEEPHFIGTEPAPTIPFDRVMTIEEVREATPFYHIREELESGHYELWVRAIRETDAGFESIISRSKPLTLQIRE